MKRNRLVEIAGKQKPIAKKRNLLVEIAAKQKPRDLLISLAPVNLQSDRRSRM
jgi:hypothetical protein